MSKHTPGPWHAHSNSNHKPPVNSVETLTGAHHYHGTYHAVVAADGAVICDNADYYPQAIDPKNRHIVAAAPDLLDVCLSALEWWESAQYETTGERGEYNVYDYEPEFVTQARAAIAKARGEA